MVRALCLLMLLVFSFPAGAELEKPAAPAVRVDESARVVALLQQGLAAERGIGMTRSTTLALALYSDAAWLGSAEAHYRIGRIYKSSNRSKANSFFAMAAHLGHAEAARQYNPREHYKGLINGTGERPIRIVHTRWWDQFHFT